MTLTEERNAVRQPSRSASTDVLPPRTTPEGREAQRAPAPAELSPDEKHRIHWVEWIAGLVALVLISFGAMQLIGGDGEAVDDSPTPAEFDPGQNLSVTDIVTTPQRPEFDPGQNMSAVVVTAPPQVEFDPGLNQAAAVAPRAEFDPGLNQAAAVAPRAEFDPGLNQ